MRPPGRSHIIETNYCYRCKKMMFMSVRSFAREHTAVCSALYCLMVSSSLRSTMAIQTLRPVAVVKSVVGPSSAAEPHSFVLTSAPQGQGRLRWAVNIGQSRGPCYQRGRNDI